MQCLLSNCMSRHAMLLCLDVFLCVHAPRRASSCRFSIVTSMTTLVGLHVEMMLAWCVQDQPSFHSWE